MAVHGCRTGDVRICLAADLYWRRRPLLLGWSCTIGLVGGGRFKACQLRPPPPANLFSSLMRFALLGSRQRVGCGEPPELRDAVCPFLCIAPSGSRRDTRAEWEVTVMSRGRVLQSDRTELNWNMPVQFSSVVSLSTCLKVCSDYVVFWKSSICHH